MAREDDEFVEIDFDWENAPPFQRIDPAHDPLMKPLFGGALRKPFVLAGAVLISVFMLMSVFTAFFVGSSAESDAYFFALQQRASDVCVGEVAYTGDSTAVVPVEWKTAAGETGAASLIMQRETPMLARGEHWSLKNVAFANMGRCPEDKWVHTSFGAGGGGVNTGMGAAAGNGAAKGNTFGTPQGGKPTFPSLKASN